MFGRKRYGFGYLSVLSALLIGGIGRKVTPAVGIASINKYVQSSKCICTMGIDRVRCSICYGYSRLKEKEGLCERCNQKQNHSKPIILALFVQLEKAKQDTMLRSNVLSIDRLVYPLFDLAPSASDSTQKVKEFLHEYSGDESIKFILFKNNTVRNDIQNLVLSILKGMCCPSVPETFGHN